MNSVSTFRRLASAAAATLLMAVPAAQAAVSTGFDGTALDANVHLDIPNAGLASVTLSGSGQLNFASTGNVDLWYSRNNAPFAWTERPNVALGETWFVETRLTLPGTNHGRLAGITFYGGPDGSGGYADNMDFHFDIDQWGSHASVTVQGLGDNSAGDLGGNLYGAGLGYTDPTVSLRAEITEGGAADQYSFFYRTDDSQAWTSLGSLNSTVDNSRAVIFLKSYQASQASFDYFNVGAVAAVPEPSSYALFGLGLLGLAAAKRRRG